MLIKLEDIKKTYNIGRPNEYPALRGVDLEIKEGEFAAIMGPSGSGKTTLMNLLGALDTSTSGRYLIKQQDISTFSDTELAEFRNKEVGFVFQQFNLLSQLSVRQNVLLPTLYGERKNAEARMLEVLRKVELADKVDSMPNQLSGGQVQRVAIARALIMKPTIIMADEPTGNLDSKTASGVMDVLVSLNKEGNTIIMVTHDDQIAKYAKRIIRIRDGKIE